MTNLLKRRLINTYDPINRRVLGTLEKIITNYLMVTKRLMDPPDSHREKAHKPIENRKYRYRKYK